MTGGTEDLSLTQLSDQTGRQLALSPVWHSLRPGGRGGSCPPVHGVGGLHEKDRQSQPGARGRRSRREMPFPPPRSFLAPTQRPRGSPGIRGDCNSCLPRHRGTQEGL
ncbi:hypothetical protein H1C71_039759 [Ictidomys tridecemlineatus]|nr:hypothetical protein H1C71_039759 [Ictidomys tridecemlineatus]